MEENRLYCSLELAQMLREKGFDNSCYACYVDDDIVHYEYSSRNSELIDGVISAPTHQMAMGWLRESHNIHIIPEITDVSQINPKYYVVIWKTPIGESYIIDLFDSYEEAVESALKYSLENII